jgi:hypothetical protein
MIRIQLIREGRVVKQITSRVHESVILEQVKKYDDAFDTIAILEGELSEDAKSILQHVAKKIIPAAMAAGVAMGGSSASAQSGPNPHYPGLNHSIGQHVADIFSPNYKEIQRQRNYERDTQRKEWDAQQGEIRRARIDAARGEGRRAVGATNQKIYDQSRVSKDGKWFVLYGMDDSITRVPTQGTEFMAGDSQRMPHYISAGGRVYYVRHPHNNGLGESVVAEGVAETLTMDEAKKVLRQYGADNFKTTSNELHFYKNGKAYSVDLIWGDDGNRSVNLSQLNSATRQLKGVKVAEDIATIGTVGTIPASGAGSMTQKTQFNKTGGTTNAKFNAQGQLELDDEELDDDAIDTLKKAGVQVAEATIDSQLEAIFDQFPEAWAEFKAGGDLDDNPDFYDALFGYYSELSPEDAMPYGTQKARDGDPVQWIADKLDAIAGNQPMGESQLNEYLVQGGVPAKDVLALNLFTDLDPQDGVSAHFEDFATDSAWRNVEQQYAPIAKALKQRILQLNRPLTDAEANAIDDTWYDGSDAYDDVDASYLAGIYDEQIDKIEALIAGNLTDEEFGESVEDDEASPADIAGADKNIIMQIRKAKDYEKPTTLELSDGTTIKIDSNIAVKMLAQFDRLRPDSKLLMQQTLNTAEGFREMLNYFNEREVQESMADIDLISNHMKPVFEARNKARNLIKSVFGKA